MKDFNYPLNLGFIKHTYFSFSKKNSLIRLTHNFFLKKIKVVGKIIDLGSGDGSNLTYYEFMDNTNAKIEKVDYFKNAETKIDLEQKLLINENQYDAVILFNTIEHIENYKNLISEIHKILKIKGKLELFVPFLVLYHPDPKDIFRPTHFYLEKILKDQGFDVDITLIGVGPFFAAYQNIFRYFKFPLFQTAFFILFDILNRIVRIFSKDYSNYYCGIHASCSKK
tara:strand:- start:251 stop:925 length:675 start_codon:yes stop_codon:yes gene_type:complete